MATRCIRGAITVRYDGSDEILDATRELLTEIFARNALLPEHVISILFTATADLTKVYPAVAAREMGLTDAALMCAVEMPAEKSLPKCLRVAVTVESDKPQRDLEHVYLRDAIRLRPDLARRKRGGAVAVAIDGPGGAGKSTLAKLLAGKMGFRYVDTGAMYRAVALGCLRGGVNLEDAGAVEAALGHLDIQIRFEEGAQRVLLAGEDVTDALRSQAVAAGSSKVAVIPKVREALVALQRKLAEEHDVVMDGRDIGTHVLPNARLKIFLDADIDERVRRRLRELRENGQPADPQAVEREMRERDHRDMTRAITPLRKAEDAVVLDTSALRPEEVCAKIIELLNTRGEVECSTNSRRL
jgi:cytidylate kinase